VQNCGFFTLLKTIAKISHPERSIKILFFFLNLRYITWIFTKLKHHYLSCVKIHSLSGIHEWEQV